MYILDTNVISELMRAQDADERVARWCVSQDADELYTTSITVAELSYGVARMPAGAMRTAITRALTVFLECFQNRVLGFTAREAPTCGMLRAAREAKGRPLPLADGMIASIAATHNATVVTRNIKDFQDLDVSVLDPWVSEG